jgi:hypothetical protein
LLVSLGAASPHLTEQEVQQAIQETLSGSNSHSKIADED